MRALLQRVSQAQVTVDGQVTGAIGAGLLIFIGFHKNDTPAEGEWMIRKILTLRIFSDDAGKMGRAVQDINGGLLIVSQFTLYGDLRKGTRPDFTDSMPGPLARDFYANWVAAFRQATPLKIEEGRFAADMNVQLSNDGPVTILIEREAPEAPPKL